MRIENDFQGNPGESVRKKSKNFLKTNSSRDSVAGKVLSISKALDGNLYKGASHDIVNKTAISISRTPANSLKRSEPPKKVCVGVINAYNSFCNELHKIKEIHSGLEAYPSQKAALAFFVDALFKYVPDKAVTTLQEMEKRIHDISISNKENPHKAAVEIAWLLSQAITLYYCLDLKNKSDAEIDEKVESSYNEMFNTYLQDQSLNRLFYKKNQVISFGGLDPSMLPTWYTPVC